MKDHFHSVTLSGFPSLSEKNLLCINLKYYSPGLPFGYWWFLNTSQTLKRNNSNELTPIPRKD